MIEPRYDPFGDLVRAVQERVSLPRLAHACASLERGERVAFGALSLSDEGLHTKEHDIAWSELDSVQIVDPVAIELRAHGRTWRRLSIGDVDHVAVLGALLRERTRVLGTHPFGILI